MTTKFFYEKSVSQRKMIAVGKEEANPRVPDPMDAVDRRVEMPIELQ